MASPDKGADSLWSDMVKRPQCLLFRLAKNSSLHAAAQGLVKVRIL